MKWHFATYDVWPHGFADAQEAEDAGWETWLIENGSFWSLQDNLARNELTDVNEDES